MKLKRSPVNHFHAFFMTCMPSSNLMLVINFCDKWFERKSTLTLYNIKLTYATGLHGPDLLSSQHDKLY